MKFFSINRIAILFLLFVGGFTTLTISFIESETFARIIKDRLASKIGKEIDADINFRKIKIGIFPIATYLIDPSIEFEKEGPLESVQLESVGIGFDFFDLLSGDFEISSIILKSGSVEISKKKSPKKKTNFNIKDLPRIRDEFLGQLPFKLNSVILEDVFLAFDTSTVFVDNLILESHRETLSLDFKVSGPNILLEESRGAFNEIDSFDLSLDWTGNNIELKNVEVHSLLSSFKFSGEVDLDKMTYQNFEGRVLTGLTRVVEIAGLEEKIEGYLDMKIKASGELSQDRLPLLSVKGRALGLKSRFIDAEEFEFEGSLFDNIFTLRDVVLKQGGGLAKLLAPADININKLGSPDPFTLQVETVNLYSRDFLKILGESLDPLQTRLSGKLNIEISDSYNSIKFKSERLTSNKLIVDLPNSKTKLLELNPYEIIEAEFHLKDLSFLELNAKLKMEDYVLPFEGVITGKLLGVNILDGRVDMLRLGKISNIQFLGVGDFKGNVFGTWDNVKFLFYPSFENVEFFGFKAPELAGKIGIYLKDGLMELSEFKAGRGLDIDGRAIFDLKTDDLKIEAKRISGATQRILSFFSPLIKLLPFELPETSFFMTTEFEFLGNFVKDEFYALGQVYGDNLRVWGENFQKFNLKFQLKEEVISLQQLSFYKGGGLISGKFLRNFKSTYTEFEALGRQLKLEDFQNLTVLNLGLSSDVSFDLYGSGMESDLVSKFSLDLKNSKVGDRAVADSSFKSFGERQEFYISGNFLGDVLKTNTFLNVDKASSKNSNIQISLDAQDMREVLGALSLHNFEEKSLSGEAKANLSLSMPNTSWRKFSGKISVSKLNLTNSNTSLSLANDLKIKLDSGVVLPVEARIIGDNSSLFVGVQGNLERKLTTKIQGGIPFGLTTFVTPVIQEATGNIFIESVANFVPGSEPDIDAEISVDNLRARFRDLPGEVSQIQGEMVLNNRDLVVKKLNAEYGKGNVSVAKGLVVLDFPFPSLSFDVELKDTTLPFFTKSRAVVSGTCQLVGDGLPYKLNGDLSLFLVEIKESIEDFKKSTSKIDRYQQYLPEVSENKESRLLELNLNLDTPRPIEVTNSLFDLGLSGNMKMIGSVKKPRVLGLLDSNSLQSRIKFRGQDFVVKKGSVNFDEQAERLGPDISLQSETQIREYRVSMNVKGRPSTVQVELTSEPALSQEDIFSLMTIGVTSDVSKELTESERQAIATVGVGSLLVDQLKLNDNLQSNLGVSLSVQPEYAQEESTLLEGRNAVSESGSSRFKSSTKVKVRKKLSKKVDLSVSSTVGGSLDQTQEMNINFQIDKRFSIEGVYEIKAPEDEDSDASDSIGVDLKYRRAF